ncbi:MAG TPA: calcium-binding protein [Oculatellaceae cyanobacterium]|jgi:Ca2+-binding RTX toxin-like protein
MAIINVDTLTDVIDGSDGVTSLREAIIEANSTAVDDTINLTLAGNYALNIPGAGEDAAATGDLDILAAGGQVTIVGQQGFETTSITGLATEQVFDILTGATLSVNDVTIVNNSTTAIRNNGTFLADRTLIQDATTGNDRFIFNASSLLPADTLDGGATGTDTFVLNNGAAGDTVTIDLSQAADQLTATGGTVGDATLQNFEDINLLTFAGTATLTGDANDNLLAGGFGADTITGGIGADTLNGGSGIDSLTGGTGDDRYIVDNPSDIVNEGGGDGIDTVISTATTYTLPTQVERFVLSGTANISGNGNELDNLINGNSGSNTLSGAGGNDRLVGNEGNDTLLGGAGEDSLTGGIGNDSMNGGAGNDTYYVDSTSDIVSESVTGVAGGTDSVFSTATFILSTNIENLSLQGTTNINGTGNLLNNNITGNAGNNSLNGGAGNDSLIGGLGNDTLTAGPGNDSLTGSDGNDRLLGNEGNDTLFGGAGVDVLNGGSGDDMMVGGTGADTYFVDSTLDVVNENGTDLASIDTVISTVTFSASKYIDRLILQGTSNVDGTTGDLNNTLTGNNGNNILSSGKGADTITGGLGDDTLIGGLGNDTLSGNAGADSFRFDAPTEGVDLILDFVSGTDQIAVLASGFGGGLTAPDLSADQFRSGAGVSSSTTATDRFLYNTSNGDLFFDADGTGAASALQIATLFRAPTLTASDIVVI